jgi:transcriptional regulator with XRE-family HTH domain
MAAWLKSGLGACRLFFTANFVRVGDRPGQGEQRVAGVGERIRKRRLELGWTQDQLCQKAGISKGFLSDLENDKRNVSATNLLDIARALSLSLDYLMTGDATVKPVTEISIPATLARFAADEGISLRQTLMLLDMQKQIVAHRSAKKKDDLESVDWRKFYESVKEFVENE